MPGSISRSCSAATANPGQIMTAAAIIGMIPEPTDKDIDEAMSGNICRCGTYVRIREAIKQAAKSAAGK